MKCPSCGYFNLPGATTCGQCRRSLSETDAKSETVSVREIMPPRARDRDTVMQLEAHSPLARLARRFAVSQWQQTREDALQARTEVWSLSLALRWWLPAVLSIVPGLGQFVQHRFLTGLIFLASAILAVGLGVLTLHHGISNWFFLAAFLVVLRSVFDAANVSFPPAAEPARHWRTLRLALLSVLLVALSTLGAFGIVSQRYELWNIAGNQAAPLLSRGDGLLVQRFATESPLLELERGDIVVATVYGTIVERVLGMPGDRVAYQNKILMVNGKVVPDARMPLGFEVGTASFETKVPPGQVLLWVRVPAAAVQGNDEYAANVRPYFLASEDDIRGRAIGLYNPPPRRQWFK